MQNAFMRSAPTGRVAGRCADLVVSAAAFGLLLAGCSASDSPPGAPSGSDASSGSEERGAPGETTFDPGPPAEGYTRFVAPVMPDLQPGDDTMFCQYVMDPLDHDLDVLDIDFRQSEGGHHIAAYATSTHKPVGTSGPCDDADNLAAGYLGGGGGDVASATDGDPSLPDGVAYRLPAGSSIMLNTHFLNTTTETFDGESVVDIKFADPDPNRQIASLFVNGTLGIEIPANGSLELVAECEMPVSIDLIIAHNHMHDHGVRASTELVRADGGASEMLHEDLSWSYEMQFNPNATRFPLDNPMRVGVGDVLRTTCVWDNESEEPVVFPQEMCFGIGYFLSDGTTSPVCTDGVWSDMTSSSL